METIDDLKENFNTFGITIKDENLLNEFIPLCSEYDVDFDTITQKFVAFSLNKKQDNILHKKSFDLFKAHLIESSQSVKPKRNVLKESNQEDLSLNDVSNMDILNSYCDTSFMNENQFKIEDVSKMENQTTSLDTSIIIKTDTYSNSWPNGETIVFSATKLSLFEPVLSPYEECITMRENGNSIFNVLKDWSDSVLKDLTDTIDLEALKRSLSPLDTTASLSQMLSEPNEEDSNLKFRNFDEKTYQDSLYFGRIINLTKNTNNMAKKANPLEKNPTKRVASYVDADEDLVNFHQTKLSQSQIGIVQFAKSVFPVRFEPSGENQPISIVLGEPVLFIGTNPTKQNIIVKKQIQLESVHLPPCITHDMLLFVASGPFLRYDKPIDDETLLTKVCKSIREKRPTLVIINGPIIDVNHPQLITYTKRTYSELYVHLRNQLIKATREIDAQIVFVASFREFGPCPIYPTPSNVEYLSKGIPEELLRERKVQFAPDPCFMQLNVDYEKKGPTLLISSTDIVMHMSGEETALGNDPLARDRITRICRKIITTGTVYPMNPANLDVPMNYGLWSKNCSFNPLTTSNHHPSRRLPHCFIIPSFINFPTKEIDDVLFMNTGLASRHYADGAYSLIQIKSSNGKMINSLKDHLILNTIKL